MLKNEKSANRIEHQNRKTDQKIISKTAKPKIPMPPSVMKILLNNNLFQCHNVALWKNDFKNAKRENNKDYY